MKRISSFIRNESGDAVVEATILFPIMIMIFAGLVLLSIYLPQRAVLQEAAQVAATAIAVEKSDAWIEVDNNAAYLSVSDKPYDNVYQSTLDGIFGSIDDYKAEQIVKNYVSKKSLMPAISTGDTIVPECKYVNYVIYQEVIVTVTQTIPTSKFGLAFVGFPNSIVLTQEARAIVQNGDEFVRNMDIAKDLIKWLNNKFEITIKLNEALGKIKEVIGFVK